VTSIFNVTFDAREPRLLARFWSEVTGYPVTEERDDLVRLGGPDAAPHLLFMKVDDPTPGKNRVHIDLAADDPPSEVARLMGLGASLVDDGTGGATGWREADGIAWAVLRDPEGNEFCVGSRPEDA
jgi:hypothetical protein